MATSTAAILHGEFRKPYNAWQNAPGSIHNDAVASKLGFRGGTIPGSVHMDQFVPMLVDLHGERWFETGGLSLHYVKATVDAEPVRAVVEPGEARDLLTMYDEAENLICTGTATVDGPDKGSEIEQRMAKHAEAKDDEVRIVADIAVGDINENIPLHLAGEKFRESLKRITEPLPIYDTGVLPPSHIISLTHQVRPVVLAKASSSVGLFGALEVQQLAGPLRADTDYVGRTRMLKRVASPKAEGVWYEVMVADQEGQDVARAIYMIRFMKASSPLWEQP